MAGNHPQYSPILNLPNIHHPNRNPSHAWTFNLPFRPLATRTESSELSAEWFMFAYDGNDAHKQPPTRIVYDKQRRGRLGESPKRGR